MKSHTRKKIFRLMFSASVVLGIWAIVANIYPTNYTCEQTVTYQSSPGSEMVDTRSVDVKDFNGYMFAVKTQKAGWFYSPILYNSDVKLDNLSFKTDAYDANRTYYFRGQSESGVSRFLISSRIQKTETIIARCEKRQ
ncbi:hypothetical protein [Pantoea sp. MBLJ3]|uniref:hypothetical protein n=1 Tax=Pantoea sp. MBLJ3 TaxID=1562889 RepID=UPI00057EDD5B|nr:hypothetical protein [Pantoea sp. MBLJ3]